VRGYRNAAQEGSDTLVSLGQLRLRHVPHQARAISRHVADYRRLQTAPLRLGTVSRTPGSGKVANVTKAEFDEELRLARHRCAEEGSLYWCGYARGLRRAFLGSGASTQIDHFAWLDFLRDEDPRVAELGRGYVDGMEAVVSVRLRAGAPAASTSAARRTDERHPLVARQIP
jgi:hypothetical protein